MPIENSSLARGQQALGGLLLWGLLALAWCAFSPGLTGTFIFDDSPNLSGLDDISTDPAPEIFLQYVTSGVSSTLGRPLTLATFAAQYYSWPWSAEDFIRVNILLHLLNGCLLAWLLLRVTRLAGLAATTGLGISLGATAWWLLAPLQASAVLYIVQRMAMFSATFMLGGTLIYVIGRTRLPQGRAASGYLLMTAGVGLGTALGTLAKENAALLPLSVLVLEATLLHGLPRDRRWRAWSAVCLWLPTLLLAAYLLWKLPGFIDGYAVRQFTLPERLLTEPRVLWLYLYKLLIPSISSIRLLYDDLPLSRGLFDPWTTAPAIAAWIALLVFALRHRRDHAPLAFAVLWFLANHLLESSVVPLEIAFEHRNYIASLGPILGLAWIGGRLLQSAHTARLRTLLLASGAGYLAFLCAALGSSTTLWGNHTAMFDYWGRTQPHSVRAQLQWSTFYFATGQPGAAVAVLERAMDQWPGDPTFPLNLLEIGCYVADGPVPGPERFAEAARRFDAQPVSTLNVFDRVIYATEEARCLRYTPGELRQLLDLYAPLPQFTLLGWHVEVLRSRLRRLDNDLPGALDHLDRAVAEHPLPNLLRIGTAMALHVGDLARARHYLRLAEQARDRQVFQRAFLDLIVIQIRTAIERYEQEHGLAAHSP